MNESPILAACNEVGGKARLANLVGVSPQAVSQWINGSRPIPAQRCPLIERATNGVVRCEQLRPDVEWAVLRSGIKSPRRPIHGNRGRF